MGDKLLKEYGWHPGFSSDLEQNLKYLGLDYGADLNNLPANLLELFVDIDTARELFSKQFHLPDQITMACKIVYALAY